MDGAGNWLPQMLGNVGFKPGESFVFHSGGGGGWGDPLERDAALVAEDVRNEIVSREQAEAQYGVILSDGLELDEQATAQRRDGASG
jgi:N-methylhydantoinase B/oxoprolinase/acetone carboxylase alpha subunit